jgi:hypothetical protein
MDRWLLVGVIAGNAIGWAIPSNVFKLVVREQHVLLGRYSCPHFCWLVVAGVLSLVFLFLHFSPSAAAKKQRAFGVVAFAMGLILMLTIADVAMRVQTNYAYAMDRYVYHRPHNAKYELPYVDAPATRRSFPRTPPGYGRVECVMTYDAQGFRNSTDVSQCDIVAVGDSFTEGSRVSDDQPWPGQLGKLSGLSVCNLGISGYSPPEYLAAVEHYGLSKKPKYVICMFYEGNDFRSDRATARAGLTISQVVANSPLVRSIDNTLCSKLGAIGARRELHELDALAWMPVRVPDREGGPNYVFAAKQLTDLSTRKSWSWMGHGILRRRCLSGCARHAKRPGRR